MTQTPNTNLILGISLFAIGIGLLVVFDVWYIGVPFILIGAHRLYVGFVEQKAAGNERQADAD